MVFTGLLLFAVIRIAPNLKELAIAISAVVAFSMLWIYPRTIDGVEWRGPDAFLVTFLAGLIGAAIWVTAMKILARLLTGRWWPLHAYG